MTGRDRLAQSGWKPRRCVGPFPPQRGVQSRKHLGRYVVHAPGHGLWETCIKKGEKVVVANVMVAGEDVGHFIGGARDVGDFVRVAMVALVEAGEAAQVCGGSIGGDRSFAVSGDGGGVVVESGQREFAHIVEGDGDIGLGEDARLFEITVGQIAGHVFRGYDPLLDVAGECRPPECRGMTWDEDDAAHACLGGIDGADGRGVVRDDLGQACGPLRDISGQGFKVAQVVAEVRGDAYPVSVGMSQTELECAEEAC